MMDIMTFQLYLLNKMSAANLVDQCLNTLGLDHEEMRRSAQRFAAALDITGGHPHSAYHGMLAEYEALGDVNDVAREGALRGSDAFFYCLPLWPKTLLQVNRHPEGWAWGFVFVQNPNMYCVPTPPADVQPWCYSVDGLRAYWRWQNEDRWSDYQRDIYDLRSAGWPMMRGSYDLGLLQEWKPETAEEDLSRWNAPLAILDAELLTGSISQLRITANGCSAGELAIMHDATGREFMRVQSAGEKPGQLQVVCAPLADRVGLRCLARIAYDVLKRSSAIDASRFVEILVLDRDSEIYVPFRAPL